MRKVVEAPCECEVWVGSVVSRQQNGMIDSNKRRRRSRGGGLRRGPKDAR